MTRSVLILAWRSPVGRERARDTVLRHGADLERIAVGSDHVVLGCDARSRVLDRGSTIVLGKLYGSPICRRGDAPLARLRSLLATGWGDYLAFAPGDDGDHRVLVDPSGAGRAHLVRDADMTMVTDRLDPLILRAAGFAVSVDVAVLAGCLLDPGTMTTAPLLHGVTPMVPGTAYSTATGLVVEALWSPAAIATGGDGDALIEAVDTAVTAMTEAGRPLIELSGGLDSSILAGTLRAHDIYATAVTVETIGGDVDEVRYAEATASFCELPLHVARTSAYPDYRCFMEARQAAHPYMYGVDDAFARAVMGGIAGETDRIVTGQGGDAVFFQPGTPLTTIDRMRALGLRSGWRALLDDARRSRSSIWHHVLPALADRIRPIGLPRDELAGDLLTRDARSGRKRFVHPWCADARDLPPGRQLQVLMLANSLVFHSERAVDLGLPLVHPLLAQPVLEAALAVPTWQLASGRFDRGLARRVFAGRLDPGVAGRRSKGEAAAFYSRAALANLPYLRERVLDGALAKAGIIDMPMMERALTPDYLFYSLDYRALILHAACEAWLGSWT